MHIVTGDLWEELGRANVLLVTTNATTNRDGKLVMGRGAAAEAAVRFPLLPGDLGEYLLRTSQIGKAYGVVIRQSYAIYRSTMLGAFQVKYHWREAADPYLIRFSANRLEHVARAMAFSRIAMNFPGTGNGRLTEEEVEPILQHLPDNVYVYKK